MIAFLEDVRDNPQSYFSSPLAETVSFTAVAHGKGSPLNVTISIGSGGNLCVSGAREITYGPNLGAWTTTAD
jgi:hypothetical protein